MLKAQYAILCEWVRPGPSGSIDLLGVFDRIMAPNVPAQHQHLVFSVLLVGDSEDDFGRHNFVQRVIGPSSRPIAEQRGSFDLRPWAGSWLVGHRMDFEMIGFMFVEFGRHRFELEVDGRPVATHPLTVVQDRQQA
jgi:hypothetical protein